MGIKILLYDSKYNIKKNKYLDYLIITDYELNYYFNSGIVNPLCVDKIKVIHTNFNENNIYMLHNSLKIGGELHLINNHDYLKMFKEYEIKKKYIVIKKKNNFTYININNRVVEFMCIGVQKGGTTSLSYNLSKHPDISLSGSPNPLFSAKHYFDINWTLGIEKYKETFDYSKKLVGEVTGSYLYLSYTFPYIQKINPFIKLIILLRNPITRAYSNYMMIKSRILFIGSFEDEINNEVEYRWEQNKTFDTSGRHYIQKGFYYNQLVELFKWFPRHNILILLHEDIIKDIQKEYNKIFKFLNINKIDIKFKRIFETKYDKEISEEMYKKLKGIYAHDIKKTEELIGIKTGWLSQN